MTAQTIALVIGASLLGAFVKSITGMGYPLLAVPVMTLGIGIEDAVVIVAIPNLIANATLCWQARDGREEARDLSRLVVWGVVGTVVGTAAFVHVPEEPLLVALAVTIVIFVVNFVRQPDLRIGAGVSHRWSPVVGGIAGVMQGAVGVSGPVVATWMHGYRLSKQAYVFSVTLLFGVTGAVQAAVLIASGRMTAERAQLAVCALIAVLTMVPIGSALRHRLAGRVFDRVVLAVLVASGLSLVIEVLT